MQSNYEVEYSLERVGMNTSKSPDNMEMNEFTRVVGTDGRQQGSARKFPGFKIIPISIGEALTDAVSTPDSPHPFFRHVVLRDNTDAIEWRGFLYKKVGEENTILGSLGLNDSVLAAAAISIDATEPIDFTTRGNLLAVFNPGTDRPRIATLDNGSYTNDQMGPSFLTGGSAGTGDGGGAVTGNFVAAEGTAGTHYLSHRGIYRLGYKVYNSKRLLYTGMSATVLKALDVAGGGDHCKLTVTLGAGAIPTVEDWDYVDLYRSQNLRNTFDLYNGGIMFKEQRITRELADDGTVEMGIVHDAELAQLERYDPWADPVQMPPNSGACLYFKGCTFAAQDPDVNAGVGLVWTNPRKTSMEEFGSEYNYAGRSGDGVVKRIIQVGELALAIAGCVTYRIQKSGLEIAIDRIWEGLCLLGPNAVVAVGSKVFMYTTQGLLVLDPYSGSFEKVAGLERIVTEEWIITGNRTSDASIKKISLSYDSRLNCVFVLYPKQMEMICVWLDTGLVTMLEGVPFSQTTCGMDATRVGFINSGAYQTDDLIAYFLTFDGYVVQVDHYRDWDTYPTGDAGANTGPTMGGHRPLYGTIPAGETDYYNTITAAYPNRILWITSGTHAGKWDALLDGMKDYTDLPTLVAGMTYAIDPVVVRLRLAPVRVEGFKGNFLRKVVKAIMLKVSKILAMDTGAVFKVGVYRNGRGSEADTGLTTKTFLTTNTDPSEEVVHLNVDGTTLEPYFECISGKGDFDLTSLKVTGTITTSRNIAAPD